MSSCAKKRAAPFPINLRNRIKGSGRIIEARKKALWAAELALERKAEDLVILDMRKVANFCDYFIICSASSPRRAAAIADLIEERFFEKGLRLKSSEGKREGMWILLDYGDVIIHVFFESVRTYYSLERLWADAKHVHVRRSREKTHAPHPAEY